MLAILLFQSEPHAIELKLVDTRGGVMYICFQVWRLLTEDETRSGIRESEGDSVRTFDTQIGDAKSDRFPGLGLEIDHPKVELS